MTLSFNLKLDIITIKYNTYIFEYPIRKITT